MLVHHTAQTQTMGTLEAPLNLTACWVETNLPDLCFSLLCTAGHLDHDVWLQKG